MPWSEELSAIPMPPAQLVRQMGFEMELALVLQLEHATEAVLVR